MVEYYSIWLSVHDDVVLIHDSMLLIYILLSPGLHIIKIENFDVFDLSIGFYVVNKQNSVATTPHF